MLKSLTLENFRKHEHLHLEFEPGTVVVRGHNEAGKSTLFQAIAYALFGARALPQPLEAVVTYGKAASSLRVTLEARIGSRDVRVVRSARGAEVHDGDRLVTGQTETAAAISELVGAPAQLATSLFFANQGAIRGALGAGSKATTSLIEQLADFGQIDRLIELIQAHLPTGTTKPFEERLAQAEATLAEIGEPVPPASQDGTIAQLREELHTASHKAQANEAALIKFEEQTVLPLRQQRAKWEKACALLARESAALDDLEGQLGDMRVPVYDEAAHEAAKARLDAAKKAGELAQRYAAAYAAFTSLPIVKSMWEGDGPSFVAFCDETERELEEAKEEHGTHRARLVDLQHQLREGECTVCGMTYDDVPAVGERNRKLRDEIRETTQLVDWWDNKRTGLEQAKTAIRVITKQWQVYRDFISQYGEYAAVDANFVPPKVTWMAHEPKPVDVAAAQADLRHHEAVKRAKDQTEGQIELLKRQIAKLHELREPAQAEADLLGDGLDRLPELERELAELEALQTRLEDEVQRLVDQIRSTEAEYRAALELHAERKRTFELARQQAETAREQLAEAGAANALLKKVRSARPAVVDRLWSVLLAAVSHYFSQMRGTQSTVTRDDGAFLVDGQPIEGLSGSTLDILGLAIRMALLKTFLPSCSMLILDEPAAACDDEREASLLGTIATAQFDQTIIVTHSDLADAYANQLVTL